MMQRTGNTVPPLLVVGTLAPSPLLSPDRRARNRAREQPRWVPGAGPSRSLAVGGGEHVVSGRHGRGCGILHRQLGRGEDQRGRRRGHARGERLDRARRERPRAPWNVVFISIMLTALLESLRQVLQLSSSGPAPQIAQARHKRPMKLSAAIVIALFLVFALSFPLWLMRTGAPSRQRKTKPACGLGSRRRHQRGVVCQMWPTRSDRRYRGRLSNELGR
jgi:hypothetical protein